MAEKMDHQGFVTKEYSAGRRMKARYYDRAGYSYAQRSRAQNSSGSSMLGKIGVCLMLCALVMISNHFNDGGQLSAVSAAAYDEEMGGEYLGKLRFVELPGIIQVFSSDAKLKVGVDSGRCETAEDDTLLRVLGCGEQTVPAPADGKVKGIEQEGENYTLELSLSNDVVVCYGSVSSVNVEEGQPIKKGDTLFTVKDGFDIRVYLGGRPVNPSDYFDIGELHRA